MPAFQPPPPPPAAVVAYGAHLSEQLAQVGEVKVFATYLHGSAALGGWQEAVSDVDILVVLAEPHRAGVSTLAEVVVSTLPHCPGKGLEMSVVSRSEAATPQPPWRFLLHVAGDGNHSPTVVPGDGHPGDPDLLLHYAVTLTANCRIVGPSAAEVIGPISRPAVLQALAEELGWGLRHATAPYALLNACRALSYLHEGGLVSKVAGGQWAIDRGIGPVDNLRRVLADRAGGETVGLTGVDAEYIENTIAQLRSAQAGPPGADCARRV